MKAYKISLQLVLTSIFNIVLDMEFYFFFSKPYSSLSHLLFVKATHLVCHRLISSWKSDLNTSLAALELLGGEYSFRYSNSSSCVNHDDFSVLRSVFGSIWNMNLSKKTELRNSLDRS